MVFFSGECLGRVKFGICDIICDIQLLIINSKILMNKNLNQNIRCIFDKKQEGQHSCKMIVRCIG